MVKAVLCIKPREERLTLVLSRYSDYGRHVNPDFLSPPTYIYNKHTPSLCVRKINNLPQMKHVTYTKHTVTYTKHTALRKRKSDVAVGRYDYD